MDDLISRAAAIAKVEKARKAARTLTGMDFVWMLKDQPAVDAAPVVHGRWKSVKANAGNNYSFWYIRCSACGYTTAMTQMGWQYCPHCGAKMDGRESE